MKSLKLRDNFYWLGIVDSSLRVFDIVMYTEFGTTYNSYLLKTGGTLVSDNVLQDGDIIESHYTVTRRNRTIYKRMREYLYELTHRKDLMTAVLPVGDGAAVSVKCSNAGLTDQIKAVDR